jgi:hypothetical protein
MGKKKQEKQDTNTNNYSLQNIFWYMHEHVLYLNNSKFFAGVIMILLNVGSKFVAFSLANPPKNI